MIWGVAMKAKKYTFRCFTLVLAIIWVVSDIYLTKTDPLKFSPYIMKNDYEMTQLAHPEKTWDKVFFGSSVVIASYIEEKSKSGYINCGVDYGSVSDIYNMLKKDTIKIGSELVIALNDISFLDSLDTNMTYLWHKKWYQHYIFFTRDKTYPLIETGITNILNAKPFFDSPLWEKQEKTVYHGVLTDEELEKSNESMLERFGGCTLRDCKENFSALEKLIDICKKKNIRLRAVWMPWNPKVPVYDFADQVMNEANRIFSENDISVYDMTHLVEPEYFHDIGHMNYELGAEHFTKLVDEFLVQ